MRGLTATRAVRLGVLAIAVLAVARAIASSSRGELAVYPDSYDYLSCAESLAAGKGYVGYTGLWIGYWPPLTSALLAGILRLFHDRLFAFGVLSALAYGVTVVAVGAWLLRHASPAIAVAGAFYVSEAEPIYKWMVAAQSEPLFMALASCFLLVLDSHVAGRSLLGRRALGPALLAILAAMCALTRYIGVATGLTAAVVLLVPGWLPATIAPRTAIRRAVAAALFLVASCGPVGLWCLLNYEKIGVWTGYRLPGQTPLWAHLRKVGWSFVVGWAGASRLALIAYLVVSAAAVGAVWSAYRAGRRDNAWPVVRPLLVFGGVYVILFAALTYFTVVWSSLDRFTVPLVIPLVLVVSASLSSLASTIPRARLPILALTCLGLVVLGLEEPWKDRATFAADARYRRSLFGATIFDYVRRAADNGRVLIANQPGVVWYASDHNADWPHLLQQAQEGDRMVWLTLGENDPQAHAWEESTRHLTLRQEFRSADGTVLTVLGRRR